MEYLPSLEHVSYVGIVLALLFSGYLLPLPEEVLLLGFGYLISSSELHSVPTTIAAMLGILGGDFVLYRLASLRSPRVSRLIERVERSRVAKALPTGTSGLVRAVFAFRFVVGLRFFGPLFAGIRNMRAASYIATDFAAVLIYVPLLLFLGYHFHATIFKLFAVVEVVRHTIFAVFLLALGAFLTWRLKVFERKT